MHTKGALQEVNKNNFLAGPEGSPPSCPEKKDLRGASKEAL